VAHAPDSSAVAPQAMNALIMIIPFRTCTR